MCGDMKSKVKIAFFSVITIVMTWMILELMIMIIYSAVNHIVFSKASFQNNMQSLINTQHTQVVEGNLEMKWGDFVEVIHPYFGFVPNPFRNNQKIPISNFGFWSGKDCNPIMKRARGKYIIGVFGGSFALGVYNSAQSIFKDALKSDDKDIIILNFSTGGYKQPQQWLILAYLLSLGAEFDMVINIDGFNEVALPSSENIPVNVYPFYPRMWAARMATKINSNTIKKIGHVEVLKSQRSRWSNLFIKYKLYWSPMACILWQYRDQLFAKDIHAIKQLINPKYRIIRSSFYISQTFLKISLQQSAP